MPKLNDRFKGFGGEEFYVQDKFRHQGGKCYCHPSLLWHHRFGRPSGVPYPMSFKDPFRNYMLGWSEVGRHRQSIIDHYTSLHGVDKINLLLSELKAEGIY